MVLMRGSHDVSSGRQNVIYEQLEKMINEYNETSFIVIATLPYRHDLPSQHEVDDEITCINTYIEELIARQPRTAIIDINKIGRRHFTKHGQYRGWSGKRVLAKMIVNTITQTPLSASPLRQTTEEVEAVDASHTAPHTLQRDSYAEVVKKSSPSRPEKTANGATQRHNPTPVNRIKDTDEVSCNVSFLAEAVDPKRLV